MAHGRHATASRHPQTPRPPSGGSRNSLGKRLGGYGFGCGTRSRTEMYKILLFLASTTSLATYFQEAELSVTIQANGVSKTFQEGRSRVVVLADVSLTVEAGQLVALMGPSGSGKSTLLAILSGLVRPDRGDVILLGRSIWDMADQQREDFIVGEQE